MSKLRVIAFLLTFAPSLICGAAPAAEEFRLVVGDWCPFECKEEAAGGLQGFMTDIARAVLSEAGARPVVVYASFSRGIQLVMENRAQVLVGIEKADAPELVYPEVEQGLATNTFYVRAGEPWHYKDVSSLAGLGKIGILRDVNYAEINAVIAAHAEKFEALPTIVDERNFNARRNLERLLAGRVDAIIQHSLVAQFELQKMGKRGAVIEAGALREQARTYVAFSPRLPDAKRYADLMSRGTEKLRASGELSKILQRYGLKDWR